MKKKKISRAIQESNDHDEFGQTFISTADIFQCSVKENATYQEYRSNKKICLYDKIYQTKFDFDNRIIVRK